jgi:hypothetical protein
MFKSVLKILILCLMNIAVYSQTITLSKIEPLKSTLKDVERILKEGRKEHFERYEMPEGIYYVSYSDGKCVTRWSEERNATMPELPPLKDGTVIKDWDIPEWIVEKVDFFSYEDLKVSSLGINLSKLKKVNNSTDTPDIFDYVDEKKGLSYTVQLYDSSLGKVVTSISKFPSSLQKDRRCKN